MVQPGIEFLSNRNMDQKDGTYTRITVIQQKNLKKILQKHNAISASNPIALYQIDMIIDYFAWNMIYGEDVGGKHEGDRVQKDAVYVYDWGSLVGEIPQKVLKCHMQIQEQLEKDPQIQKSYKEIGNERARLLGWESMT